MKTTRTLYAEKLAAEGIVSGRGRARRCWTTSPRRWKTPTPAAKSYKPNKADWLEGHWAGFTPVDQQEVELTEEATAVPTETLKQIGAALAHVPDELQPQSEDRPPA